MTKQHKIIISIVAVLILFGAYIAFDMRYKKGSTLVPTDSSSISTTTSTIIPGTGVGIVGSGQYKIERVSLNDGKTVKVPIPDLSRPVIFGNTYTEDVKNMFSTKIKALQAELQKDPTNLSAWIDLGVYQKSIGDYIGAAISWKYVGAVADHDFVSFGNLGDLYAYFLKDNAMAEVYYNKAIANGPTHSYLYIQLASVYRDVFKDMDKARAIIAQGLARIPNDPSLLEFKKNLN